MSERFGDVVVATDGVVVRATIDRASARNALSPSVVEGLSAAVEQATSGGARVLVVRGAGGTFCAGADLAHVLSVVEKREAFAGYVRTLVELFDAFEAAPFVTVGVIEGFALAGGCEMLLACDVTIADEKARIGDRHLELALIPGAGGSVRLPRALSPAQARWLLFSGEMISGRQAAEWGLVTRAVAAEELDATVEAMVARLASRSGETLAAAKRLLMAVRDVSVAEGLRLEHEVIIDHLTSSADTQEGLRAFAEGRPPDFSPARSGK